MPMHTDPTRSELEDDFDGRGAGRRGSLFHRSSISGTAALRLESLSPAAPDARVLPPATSSPLQSPGMIGPLPWRAHEASDAACAPRSLLLQSTFATADRGRFWRDILAVLRKPGSRRNASIELTDMPVHRPELSKRVISSLNLLHQDRAHDFGPAFEPLHLSALPSTRSNRPLFIRTRTSGRSAKVVTAISGLGAPRVPTIAEGSRRATRYSSRHGCPLGSVSLSDPYRAVIF